MQTIILIYFFIIGTVFGSFFNVVGLRVPKQKLFENERSYCPHCHRTLSWYELIPIFSFLLQKGRCRHCSKPISYIYPLIEVITGLLFAFSFYAFGFQVELITSLLLMSLLIIIVITDIHYMLIPDRILLFFLPFFIAMRILHPLNPWWSPIVAAVVGILLLALIIIASRGGMGGGDMKLFGLLGIILGTKKLLLAFLLSSLLGTVISVILIGMKIVDRKQPIPFGPYIVVATIITYFYGEIVIDWYLTVWY